MDIWYFTNMAPATVKVTNNGQITNILPATFAPVKCNKSSIILASVCIIDYCNNIQYHRKYK